MSLANAIRALRFDEGFRGYPYRCTGGALTIGFGRNLDSNPLTPDEGEYLLRRDLIACNSDLHAIFGAELLAEMGEWRRVALVNMRYQLGGAGLRSFRRMLMALREQDYTWAAAEAADSLWASQTPVRAERVIRALAEDVNAWMT